MAGKGDIIMAEERLYSCSSSKTNQDAGLSSNVTGFSADCLAIFSKTPAAAGRATIR